MMKQKKWVTYLLAVLVVGIWGIILQRILTRVDPETDALVSGPTNFKKKEKLPHMQPDTFLLLLNYPDPFSINDIKNHMVNPGSIVPVSKGQEGPSIQAAPIPATPIRPVEQINYLGFVQNPVSKKRIAIINYNNKEAMLSEGERFANIQLIDIEDDAIKIRVDNQLRNIRKSL